MNSDNNIIKKGITSALSVKIISLIISTLVIPLYISYFKDEYAIIIVLISFTAYLSLAHLGVPYSLITISTQFGTLGEKNYFFLKLAKIYLPYILFLVLLVVLFKRALTDSISTVLKFETSDIILSAIFWAILYTLLNLFFLFFHSIFQAVNNLRTANLYQGFLTVIPSLSLLFCFYFKYRINTYFLICFLMVVVVGVIMASHYLIYYSKKIVIENSYRSSIKNIFATSVTALVLNVISVSMSSIDILMMSSFNIADSVIVNYSVLQKVVSLQLMIFGTICSTLLPMFGKWYGLNNFKLISFNYNIFLKSMLTVFSIIIFFNVLFMKDILHIWIGETVFIGNEVLLILSLSIYVYISYSLSYTVLHSFNIKRKLTLVLTVFETLLKMLISFILIKIYGYIGAAVGVLLFGLLIEFPLYTWMLDYYSNRRVQLEYRFLLKHSSLMLIYLYIFQHFVSALDLSFRIILFFLISFLYLFSNYIIIKKDDRELISKLIKVIR
jgi:O-antigen/teichoic acid export membrane protein